MHTILVVAHLFLAIGVIGLVLMQHGKGADAGAAFGSGASGTVFGSQGSANFLSRSTGILAALFFVTSLALAWFAMQTTDRGGLMDKVEIAPPAALLDPKSAVPAIPGGSAPAGATGAVPVVPEGKATEVAATPVEAPAKAPEQPVEPPATPAPEAAPQVVAPAEPASTEAAPAVGTVEAAKATEQVPAKTE